MNDTAKAFFAGALLPTIAYYFYRSRYTIIRKTESRSNNNSSSKSSDRKLPVGNNHKSHNINDSPGHRDTPDKVAENNDWIDNDDYDDDDSGQLSWSEKNDENNDTTTTDQKIKIDAWGMIHAPYKMVLCVNTDLNMGKGKIAAQCCHAAVGCYKRSTALCPNALRAWERTGCAKVALKCPNLSELENIARRASQLNIPFYLVEDAGRTQIAAGSRTVLGLFGPVSVFEGVTDHLKLM
jgi:peptidyl-tRNA hydrolase, PTH2 family